MVKVDSIFPFSTKISKNVKYWSTCYTGYTCHCHRRQVTCCKLVELLTTFYKSSNIWQYSTTREPGNRAHFSRYTVRLKFGVFVCNTWNNWKLFAQSPLLKQSISQFVLVRMSEEVLSPPISPSKALLQSWLNKIMKVKISDGRRLIGSFLCSDKDMNMILGSCQEFVYGEGTKQKFDILGHLPFPPLCWVM